MRKPGGAALDVSAAEGGVEAPLFDLPRERTWAGRVEEPKRPL